MVEQMFGSETTMVSEVPESTHTRPICSDLSPARAKNQILPEKYSPSQMVLQSPFVSRGLVSWATLPRAILASSKVYTQVFIYL